MVDSRIWKKAKNPSYKLAIVAYGAAVVGIPSQIAYDGCKKTHHAILLWLPFNTTDS